MCANIAYKLYCQGIIQNQTTCKPAYHNKTSYLWYQGFHKSNKVFENLPVNYYVLSILL